MNNSRQLDRSFVALAHPVRRAIVERLARGPASIGEATAGLGVTKPAVTKHVKALEQAGVVRRSVEGRRHTLLLETRPLAEASRWLDVHRALWEAKLDTIAQQLAAEDA